MMLAAVINYSLKLNNQWYNFQIYLTLLVLYITDIYDVINNIKLQFVCHEIKHYQLCESWEDYFALLLW